MLHRNSAVNFLTGVAALSANDVWTVGEDDSSGALIEHWNGTKWSVVPSPSPGTFTNTLNGVIAVSVNNIWAVGDYTNDGQSFQTLIEHWNGIKWQLVKSPNIPGSRQNWLYGVAAASTSDVWAVGYYYNPGVAIQTLTEFYC